MIRCPWIFQIVTFIFHFVVMQLIIRGHPWHELELHGMRRYDMEVQSTSTHSLDPIKTGECCSIIRSPMYKVHVERAFDKEQ